MLVVPTVVPVVLGDDGSWRGQRKAMEDGAEQVSSPFHYVFFLSFEIFYYLFKTKVTIFKKLH